MIRPEITVIDAITQEQTVREMNDEEYSMYISDKQLAENLAVEAAAKQAEVDAAKAAVHEKLSELGITPELIEVIKKL